jgi:hypothetical protein
VRRFSHAARAEIRDAIDPGVVSRPSRDKQEVPSAKMWAYGWN